MEKIRDIVSSLKGQYVEWEAHYAEKPSDKYRPDFLKSIARNGEIYCRDQIRDVNILDLWAVDYELMDKDAYDSFGVLGGTPFEEQYYPDDVILVIWLSPLSYRILTDSSVMTVREARTKYIGQYHEYLVVKAETRNHGGYDDDCYGGYDDYDYYDRYLNIDLNVVKKPLDVLDNMYVDTEKTIFMNDDNYISFNINDAEDPWWEKDEDDEKGPFELRFGDPNAEVLILVLA